MNKLEIFKTATSFVVGIGTSKIVADIIKTNTSPKSVTDKVTMLTAAMVIGSMASDATKAYTDEKIDEVVAWYYDRKTPKD